MEAGRKMLRTVVYSGNMAALGVLLEFTGGLHNVGESKRYSHTSPFYVLFSSFYLRMFLLSVLCDGGISCADGYKTGSEAFKHFLSRLPPTRSHCHIFF